MNFTQLTVFRTLMETGSVSETARKLGRTQPAISLAVQNLEKTLDLTLFERRGRRLIPVPEARYLFAEATSILDRLSTVSGTMKGLRSAQTGSLNVAAMPGPSAYIFPKFISENVHNDAGFQTSIASRSSSQIRELASTQSIDFGFADFEIPEGKTPQYASEIISAQCFLAVAKSSPLARKSSVSIADLDKQPIGTLHVDHPLTRKLSQIFNEHDAQMLTTIATQFFLPLIPFISSGHCCSVVDPLTMVTEQELNMSKSQIVFVPFAVPLRYEYATLTPLHRPPSKLATRVKDTWIATLFDMLENVDAAPAHHASEYNR